MVTVYGIKNCDSVKKALSFFKKHEIEYNLVDFKSTQVDCATIKQWLEHTDLKTLFNTRGTTYRTLGLKALNLDDEAKIEWLGKENMLIKRPVVEHDGTVMVGFDLARYEGAFLS
jgi:Spx/MgsR family transcriptional regulator